jgi:hypothetical protein
MWTGAATVRRSNPEFVSWTTTPRASASAWAHGAPPRHAGLRAAALPPARWHPCGELNAPRARWNGARHRRVSIWISRPVWAGIRNPRRRRPPSHWRCAYLRGCPVLRDRRSGTRDGSGRRSQVSQDWPDPRVNVNNPVRAGSKVSRPQETGTQDAADLGRAYVVVHVVIQATSVAETGWISSCVFSKRAQTLENGLGGRDSVDFGTVRPPVQIPGPRPISEFRFVNAAELR